MDRGQRGILGGSGEMDGGDALKGWMEQGRVEGVGYQTVGMPRNAWIPFAESVPLTDRQIDEEFPRSHAQSAPPLFSLARGKPPLALVRATLPARGLSPTPNAPIPPRKLV